MSLHTRNTKYGKLENGLFLKVSPALIKRCSAWYYHDLSSGDNVSAWVIMSLANFQQLSLNVVFVEPNFFSPFNSPRLVAVVCLFTGWFSITYSFFSFHTLSCGVDIILANNGYLWITVSHPKDTEDAAFEHVNSVANSPKMVEVSPLFCCYCLLCLCD